MNLKFETNVQIFRKIMQLNAVSVSKSPNEYSQKMFSKSGLKMDLYPALVSTEGVGGLGWGWPGIRTIWLMSQGMSTFYLRTPPLGMSTFLLNSARYAINIRIVFLFFLLYRVECTNPG